MTWGPRLNKAIVLSAIAVLGLALGACAGDDDDGGAANGDGGVNVATQPSGGGATGGTITIVMTDNKYTPNKIEVEAGKEITFIAKNQGAAVHNMKILSSKTEGKDFASDALVNPEKESKFTVTFTKKGTVKFQCDYHLPDMAGEITVK